MYVLKYNAIVCNTNDAVSASVTIAPVPSFTLSMRLKIINN